MSQKLVIPCVMSDATTRNLTINYSREAEYITAEAINAAMNPIIESAACRITTSSAGHVTGIKGDPYVEVVSRTDISMS